MVALTDEPVDGTSDGSFRVLLALSVAVPLLLFVAAAWYDYRQTRSAAELRLITTVDALAEHAEKVFETNQLVLTLMSDRVRGMSWDQIDTDKNVYEFLVRLTKEQPQLASAFFVAPSGQNSASSRSYPMHPYDDSTRDYFKAAKAGDANFFISAPFVSQMAHTSAFTVTQPVDRNNPAGGLAGLTLSPGYFERFYQAVTEGPVTTAAALLRSDGVVLVHYPDTADFSSKLTPASLPYRLIDATEPSGMIEGAARRDNTHRIVAYRRLTGYPVFATCSIAIWDALAPWYEHVVVLAAFAVLLAIVMAQSTRAATRRAREERRGLQALIAEKARRENAEEAVRQLQKIEALGRLTGGVAHDFNNLLTAVMGSLELAMKRSEDPRVVRLLNGAMEAAVRGARLTQQMLAFSRQQNVLMAPVSVNDVLNGMDEMLRRTLGPEIRVSYMLEPDLRQAVADATQLEVAVLNLAINARDAMPLGGSLRLQTANVSAADPRASDVPPGDLVMLAVIDTGAGMAENVRRRATEPFFTTKDVGRGTGLGLSMVDGFARQAGGALTLESAPGQGTTARIYLPRAATAAQPNSAPTSAVPSDTPALRILLVDDDDGVRSLTGEMLHEMGHSVIEVPGGTEAINKLGENPDIQFLMVDFAMPMMNGGDVARRVSQLRPNLPILFTSGYTERTGLEEWIARGYRLLSKPFTMPQLAEAIALTLERESKIVDLTDRRNRG